MASQTMLRRVYAMAFPNRGRGVTLVPDPGKGHG
jgi:hypothetical protein